MKSKNNKITKKNFQNTSALTPARKKVYLLMVLMLPFVAIHLGRN
jgi:hypothetical protein